MSIETALGSEKVVEERTELMNAVAVLLGSFVVFAGTFVLFAASPVMSVDPVFAVSSVEPLSVVANMAAGASIMTAGAEMSVSKLEDLL